jgi:hypothetical protein
LAGPTLTRIAARIPLAFGVGRQILKYPTDSGASFPVRSDSAPGVGRRAAAILFGCASALTLRACTSRLDASFSLGKIPLRRYINFLSNVICFEVFGSVGREKIATE